VTRGIRLPLILIGSAALLVAVAGQRVVTGASPGQTKGRASPTPLARRAIRFVAAPALDDAELARHPRSDLDDGEEGGEAEANKRVRTPVPGLVESAKDGALQLSVAPLGLMPAPGFTFEGLGNEANFALFGHRVRPPDTNGDVGPRSYVQIVNLAYQVFSKAGTQVTAPRRMSDLFGPLGPPCGTVNHGDPIALYDPLADRWLLSQLCIVASPNFHVLVAVSQTGDAQGAYYLYDFMMPNEKFNDYPHFGVWPDGYYMTDNEFSATISEFLGGGVFAFDRDKMLAGDPTASYIYFDLADRDRNIGGMLPADMDGLTPPPRGTPNYFAYFTADEFGDPADALRIFEFHADFANPENSTFTERPESPLPVSAFDPREPRTGGIPQPAPSDLLNGALEVLGDRILHRLAYRNFGDHESLVVNHTVNIGAGLTTSTFHAGVRYYEMRRPLPGGAFAINEQATFAPDGDNRWMGSAAMDHQGNLAVGYSVSSRSTLPAIRYAGRLATDPPNGLFQGEATMQAGLGVQGDGGFRWGDYSALNVDPTDDCTFWYTTEYFGADPPAAYSWQTRVGRFSFPGCTPAPKGVIQGVVTDAATGMPIKGVTIRTPLGYTAFTNGTGLYSMTVVPGSYDMTASGTDLSPQSVEGLVVTDDGRTIQDFVLAPHLVPVLQTAGAPAIETESCSPVTGTFDPGETVSVALGLRNVGKAAIEGLEATLLPTGGVTAPGPSQSYGAVPADGSVVTRTFTFTAAVDLPCGAPLTLTLSLSDGSTDLGTLSYDLRLGALGPRELMSAYGPEALPVRIPDPGAVEVPIPVGDDGVIADVDVRLRLNYPHNQNLIITVIHPDGTKVDLYHHGGFEADRSGANFGDGQINCSERPVLFDDSAIVPIRTELAPYVRVPVRPDHPLSALNGKALKGVYRLRIESVGSFNFGVLGCVQLLITRQVPLCCPFHGGRPAVTAGTALPTDAESCHPANGAPDADETVTMSFPLNNEGTGATTDLIATLLPGGGVESPSGPQSYGVMGPIGSPASRSFTFVPRGICGSGITATLALEDVGGAGPLGTVALPIRLGGTLSKTYTFSSAAPIRISGSWIDGAADPYPSTISTIDPDEEVGSHISGAISKVTVTLRHFSHPLPAGVYLLLVGPGGQSVVLMSGAGWGYTAADSTLTLDDDAAEPIPYSNVILSGTFRPTANNMPHMPVPAPPGPFAMPPRLSVFNGLDPNGTWSLYAQGISHWDLDDPFHNGRIDGGWSVHITTSRTWCCNEPCNLTCPADVAIESEPGQCGAPVTLGRPGITGSCGTVACQPSSPAHFGLGTTDATCTATPTSGGAGTACGFGVSVTAATATRIDTASVQYSDIASFHAAVDSIGCPNYSGSMQFLAEGSPVGSAPVSGNGGVAQDAPILLPAGAHPITAAFSSGTPGLLDSSGSSFVTVTREDATVTPLPAALTTVKVSAPGSTVASLRVSAQIAEIPDGHPGQIANAVPVTFSFVPAGPGSASSCTATGGTVSGGTLVASCDVPNLPVEIYDVTIGVGGDFYAGAGRGVVAVYDPSLGSIMGSGTLLRQGAPANVQFNLKYLKQGTLQGSLQYVEHRPAGDVVLASTSMLALSIVGDTGLIQGTATLGSKPGYTFRVIAVDGGSSSRFGLEVIDPSGAAVGDLSFPPGVLRSGVVRIKP
jgi:Carboxypeptidase regulatory-like domain